MNYLQVLIIKFMKLQTTTKIDSDSQEEDDGNNDSDMVSSSEDDFTEFMVFLRNSSFLTLPGLFVVIAQTRNEFSIISR